MEQSNDKRLPILPSLGGETPIKQPDVLVIQQIGAVVLAFGVAERDTFIDDIDRSIPYPDDAP